MNFTFETLGSSNFLVYELQPNDQLDTMSLGMLTNNSIPGLAEAVFTQMDDKKYIKYNITSKLTAATVFSSPMSKKRLLTILSSMVNGLLKTEDYMLDPSSILLDSEHIFVDGTTGEAVLICLPVLQDTRPQELGAFFKEVVFNWTKFEQGGDFGFMAELLNYLNSVPVLSLRDFKGLVDRLANTRTEQKRTYDDVQSRPAQPVNIDKMPAFDINGVHPRPPKPEPEKEDIPPRSEERPGKGSPISKLTGKFGTGGPHFDQDPPAAAQDEKKMTMWDLLTHFSKENLELYKAQKDGDVAPEPPVKRGGRKDEDSSNDRGFFIPGDPPPAFEIPVDKSADEREQDEPVKKAPKLPPMVIHDEPVKRDHIRFDTPKMDGDLTIVDDMTTGGDQTIINQETGPCLIRVQTGEVIELNKPNFKIGRERRAVDYAITGNPSISKSHIEIRFRAGQFEVFDEKSTNHTFVNGKQIAKKVWIPIRTGDIVKLSNEEFECKLN